MKKFIIINSDDIEAAQHKDLYDFYDVINNKRILVEYLSSTPDYEFASRESYSEIYIELTNYLIKK